MVDHHEWPKHRREIEINFLWLAWLPMLLSTRDTSESAIWNVKLKWNKVIKNSPFQLVRRKLFFNSPLTQLRWRALSPWSWCWWMRFHSFTIWMSSIIRDSSRKKSFQICFESELTNWKFNDTRWHPERPNLVLTFFYTLCCPEGSPVFLERWELRDADEANKCHPQN